MSDDETGGFVGFSVEGRSETPFWGIHRMWQESADLPIVHLPLTQFTHLFDEEQAWFAGKNPTLREIAEQARRIYEADLSYPIIFMANGEIMDGKHRLAQAFLKNHETIAAVRFTQNPEPDFWQLVSAPSGDEKNAANEDGFVIMVDGVVVDRLPS